MLNKAELIGRLGDDPEIQTFQNGGKIANLSIATSERWTDKNTGNRVEHTEWHKVVLNQGLADVAAQYLKKGSQVYIEGRIRTEKWTDKDGIERYTTKIRADKMIMLGSKNDNATAQPQQGQQQAYAPQQGYQGQPQQGYAPQQQGYAVQQSPMTSMQRPPSHGHAPQQPQQGYQQPQQGYQGQPQQGYAIDPAPAVADDDMPF